MDLNAFYKIGCGMYIVSTAHGGKLNGQLVNAVVQVTAEPPQIAVSLNKQNLTCQMCAKSGVLTVSVLDKEAPMTFMGRWGFKSGRDIDKFEGVQVRMGKNGAPIVLDHALAYFEAKVTGSIDAGTHLVLIAEVTEAEILRDEEPMDYMYYRMVKKGLTSKFAASYQAKPGNEGTGRTAQGIGTTTPEPANQKGGMDSTAARMSVPPLAAPARYRCNICGYVYDPENGDPDSGVKPGTPFESLPEGWKCPVCGAGKERFTALPP
jgi:flavin reductase (DIM6/NTAB) family NADH-FMN oxidoreductase RutF/rubredoxin